MQITKTGRREKVSKKYNKLTDYLDVTAESEWTAVMLTDQAGDVHAYIIVQGQILL